ncbi:uncharacterized protein LOC135838427 [Planococcus citri]|uniref:uncharacterized protein LOC135838427 n=1 Tax=Planococcus citri TaxID=170843 RepID=UPI0031F9ED91
MNCIIDGFYCGAVLVLITFVLFFTVSCSSPTPFIKSKDVTSNNTRFIDCEKKLNHDEEEAPWHVIINYIPDPSGIGCTGTIISPWLILTVEYNVFSRPMGSTIMDADPNHYEILVARLPYYLRVYKIAEFRYFNQTSFIHDWNRNNLPMIVVLKEKLSFNPYVSPAYIHWENPSKIDTWNGTAKIAAWKDSINTFQQIQADTPILRTINFTSHIACRERRTYPYFLFFMGAFLLRQNVINITLLHDANLMCVEYPKEQDYVFGSGVITEENDRHFIRGIMGLTQRLAQKIPKINEPGNRLSADGFKTFTDCIRGVHANSSKLDENIKYWCNIARLVKPPFDKIENNVENTPKFGVFTDIADYIDWIKQVRDETESRQINDKCN